LNVGNRYRPTKNRTIPITNIAPLPNIIGVGVPLMGNVPKIRSPAPVMESPSPAIVSTSPRIRLPKEATFLPVENVPIRKSPFL
jgi:hypothetical protein